VCDNGVGFDPTAMMQPDKLRKAWGLIGMQERAGLINAKLDFKSEAGAGTTLTISM
jgi:signal transduction histidine kinase